MTEREKRGPRAYVIPSGSGVVPLQVVLWSAQRDSIILGPASLRVEIPNNAALIELSASENCYINFGDVTVVASSVIATDGSRLFIAGVQVVPVPIDPATDEPYTYIAALQQGTGGILQVEQVY
jgi:hypothetical protein